MPFENNIFNTIFATEVFEHIHDLETALNEIYRVLKKDGIIFFTVPFLWPLYEAPNDEYRYTPYSLEKIFKKAGFSEITIKPTGGWDASLAQMLGLWVRRKPMSSRKRRLYSKILKPIIKKLIKKDWKTNNFKKTPMITGLFGIVKK